MRFLARIQKFYRKRYLNKMFGEYLRREKLLRGFQEGKFVIFEKYDQLEEIVYKALFKAHHAAAVTRIAS